MCWGGMRTTIRSVSSSFWVPALTASMGDTSGDKAVRLSRQGEPSTGPGRAQPAPNAAVAHGGTGSRTDPRHSCLHVSSSTVFPPAATSQGSWLYVAPTHTCPGPSHPPAAPSPLPVSPRLGLKPWPRASPSERRGEEEADVLVTWPGTEPGTAEGPGATLSRSFSAFSRSTSSWGRTSYSTG